MPRVAYWCICDTHMQVDVPLTATQSDNLLQKQWLIFERFMQASVLIEEVYAIRSSLVTAKEKGFIVKDEVLNGILSHYKQVYGKLRKLFEIVYDAFDLTVKKIGPYATDALIMNVLSTRYPDYAFTRILSTLCPVDSQAPNGIRWNLSAGLTSRLANITSGSRENFAQLYNFFSSITDELDPDDSLYMRKEIAYAVDEIKRKRQSGLLQHGAEGIDASFFYGSHKNYLLSYHDNNGIHFLYKLYITEEGDREEKIGESEACFIFNEAILQQLVKGIGLLCPLWVDCYPDKCCIFRSLLEKIWSCTSHNRSCNWKRMGCLNQ